MKLSTTEQSILRKALVIAEKAMTYGEVIQSPDHIRNYLKLWAADAGDQEHFGVIWMTTQHGIIGTDVLFHGTIDAANVYVRPLIAKALERQAGACVLFHNHPSGNSEPSQADRILTTKIKSVLESIEVRVLDHMVIGRNITSFAEIGEL